MSTLFILLSGGNSLKLQQQRPFQKSLQCLTTTDAKYGSEAITVLKGLEPVRKRPGMYIGNTGSAGLHHLVFEIVDNAVDEALAGHCTEISISLEKDGSVEIQDNGRGIPCTIHPSTGKSSLETVLCVLHAGGKFGGECSGYKVSGGLHGVGLSVVNALSDHLTVEVVRDNIFHTMKFMKGEPITELTVRSAIPTDKNGTKVIFHPDPSIFKTTLHFEYEKLASRLDELAYLNAGLVINLIDKRASEPGSMRSIDSNTSISNNSNTGTNNNNQKDVINQQEQDQTQQQDHNTLIAYKNTTFRHDGGIKELVAVLCNDKKPLVVSDTTTNTTTTTTSTDLTPSTERIGDVIFINENMKGVGVQIALRWSSDSYIETTHGFANGIRTADGGSHLDGFKSAVTKTVNTLARKLGKIKEASIPGEFIREGLTAVVSVKVPEPEFEGQTKTRLGNPEVRQIVDVVVSNALQVLFEWQPVLLSAIFMKALSAQNAAIAARAAREMVRRKSLLTSTILPGKLSDCSSRNPEETEIYIVEGDSAAGSAKLGRDRRTQAILPLKGKILNIEKASNDKIYQNTELQALISALGLGVKGSVFDPSQLRYHRIVIMTDADVDGAHIRLLLLTFLYRYQPELIEKGYVYIACPPLYKVTSKTTTGNGKSSGDIGNTKTTGEIGNIKATTTGDIGNTKTTTATRGKSTEMYLYDQASLDEYLQNLPIGSPLPQLQRFKGLGEMMPVQLWDTTMDPTRRTLKLVSIEDASVADRMFSMLMGDSVMQRKEFIMENAAQMITADLDV